VQGSGNIRGKDGLKLLLGESKEKSKGYRKSKRKVFDPDPDFKMSTERKEEFHVMKIWIIYGELQRILLELGSPS